MLSTVEFSAFGCANRITAFSGTRATRIREAIERARLEALRIQSKFSRYDPQSVVSLINRSAGIAPYPIDSETSALLSLAAEAHRQSGGLFDLTSGVLRKAWDFKRARVPTNEEIAVLLPLIGWDKVVCNEAHVFLPDPGMELDFGGIGKEYAVDCAARVLRENGVESALINFGGDVAVIGTHPSGRPWSIGVQHPREHSHVTAVMPLQNSALATSGDYERFFIHEGKRFCHLLNPFSGFPACGFASVTVISERCVVAGIASTTAMLMEQPRAKEFLTQLGVTACAVNERGELWCHGVPEKRAVAARAADGSQLISNNSRDSLLVD